MRVKRHNLKRNNAGVAMILALMFVVLLTIIVVEFGFETQVESSYASYQSSDLEARLAAESAIANGLALLAEDLLRSSDPTMAPMANQGDFDCEMDWAGVPFEFLNDAQMQVTITDEFGKINLNALLDNQQTPPTVRPEMRQALIEFFLLRSDEIEPEPIVDAIIDWLDFGDDDAEEPEGAENDYYLNLENPYPCKNGPMDSVEELLLIRGMTPELYFGVNTDEDEEEEAFLQQPLSEYFTVNGHWKGAVNINTALPEVICAVNNGFGASQMSLEDARGIYQEIHGIGLEMEEGLPGGMPVTGEEQLGNYIVFPNKKTEDEKEDPKDPATVNPVTEAFTWKSDIFRIQGDGMFEEVMVRIEAHVWRNAYIYGLPERLWEESGVDLNLQPEPPQESFRILAWKVIR